ncbi:class I SAM-dependent methyltransferase [Paucibacter sp. KCTC 42545]|uniref:class I SAM-dependent methyltransferase n=1 Tax=Paucibacter sp. KCTC 42545 TaxID=1768242 RepID=UPI000733A1CA|nr:class I SAM-dependent methyltransferase [Paucibacter sp. KCTC 42545]ALT76448.1 hypothetical protein AT984_03720 [Paucibacter sp. KCTC 42545]
MSLEVYRASAAEQARTQDLLRLFPATGRLALDIGARDGHFSRLLAERFEQVIALDLTLPQITHPRVRCVAGDAAAMEMADGSLDFVFCAEVLEHIPPALLSGVCREIERVAGGQILIGVPYRQDIRVGRCTCGNCGLISPPWGHVNSFDEARLAALFPACSLQSVSFVGSSKVQTNALSTRLMDWAGNPYGTYEQEEPCIHCGARMKGAAARSPAQKVATKLAFWTRGLSGLWARPHGNWIHMLLAKR